MPRTSLLAAALCAALAAAGFLLQAQRGPVPARAELRGTVVAVHDGDTLTLRSDAGPEERVRLAQIDAPERGQPWSRRARHALARLTYGSQARLEVVDRDDYGRAVGDLYLGDLFVNEHLVREGHAWAYPRYVRSPAIVEAEDEARREARGLWRLPPARREPPWEWRRAHPRRGSARQGPSPGPPAGP